MKRRTLLKTAAVSLAGANLPILTLAMSSGENAGRAEYDYILTAEPAKARIAPNGDSDILGFNGQFPAPLIRAKQGQTLRVMFINKLNEPTTIHWHGIRIENNMDGVPHLTQAPVPAGGTFLYEFTCPDAGTFWYHPHMNSVEQLGKGLVGALIVEETIPQDYHDVIIGLKDWRLNKDGSYLPLSIPREAFRDGTLGTIATVNGQLKPTIDVPAGERLRLRILNMDNTRVFNLSMRNESAQIIAIDGNPIAVPIALDSHPTGAGMRLDLGYISPNEIGAEIPIFDMKGRFGLEICRLKTVPPTKTSKVKMGIPALPLNPVPAPDLLSAKTLNFAFEWAGALSPSNTKGQVDHNFWLINRRAWSDHSHQDLPDPLAILKLGKSYIFELHNATPHHHPIHLHGLIFTVLESDKKDITPFHTDTILLEKNEHAKIAFVADNPGKWMFHCHVIEHMKTGLMGYITIK
ncbi:Multicopper oxidase MmcO [Zhongshania aliphaticivorans]|uniref:Multicopper oxidase MmcO n=1 Tax=Zhongshania aliphaticivorans TaxID=1470434 RepID=A0A5S9QAG3_9GAMM|nr:multicopper oxidase family protein [Zhongshania aliphaticivorans]CAA0087552.1 Multicopper oxidase MmcO [Zhongshania aliphaticivorans]CAA0115090.1 Multicopper oxidase MmcO [Zhongshania aliphaticivorans]CAA0119931.1 Multicopper oxidase MmcO [Zhongshania aliphaticivorans]